MRIRVAVKRYQPGEHSLTPAYSLSVSVCLSPSISLSLSFGKLFQLLARSRCYTFLCCCCCCYCCWWYSRYCCFCRAPVVVVVAVVFRSYGCVHMYVFVYILIKSSHCFLIPYVRSRVVLVPRTRNCCACRPLSFHAPTCQVQHSILRLVSCCCYGFVLLANWALQYLTVAITNATTAAHSPQLPLTRPLHTEAVTRAHVCVHVYTCIYIYIYVYNLHTYTHIYCWFLGHA